MTRLWRQRRTDDSGAALVMVLGIASVSVLLLTTLAMTTVYTLQTTARTKAEMEVLASADAGIDLFLGQLEDKTFAELSGVCSPSTPYVVNNDAVTVTTEYTLKDGSTTPCPTATQIVTVMKLTSTAVSSTPAVDGSGLERTVMATFQTTPPSASLDKAIFSEAQLELINNTTVSESASGAKDANVYSNGQITIKTQVDVDGHLYSATGDVTVDNQSELAGSLWAAGKVTLATQAKVQGDVYAASDARGTDTWGNVTSAAVTLGSDSTYVKGSVLTNGTIVSSGRGTGGIKGIAFARLGQIYLQNDATVGGSAYAGGNVRLQKSTIGGDVISQNGNVVIGGEPNTVVGKTTANNVDTFTSQHFTNYNPAKFVKASGTPFPEGTAINPSSTQFTAGVGYPYLITAPKREGMPRDGFRLAEIKAWPGFTQDPTDKCTGNDPINFIKDNPNGVTGPRMIIFTCSNGKPVELDGSGNKTLTFGQNTALVSMTGFSQSNNVAYEGTNATDWWTVYWIVPSDAPGVTWQPAAVTGQFAPVCDATSTGARNLYWDQMKLKNVKWFAYSPCKVELKNGNNLTGNTVPLTGQIYAGAYKAGAAVKIQMSKIAIPSLGGDPVPTDPADVRLTSRFDLRD